MEEFEDSCILCLEPDNLFKYNHCGNIFIHPKCLLLWYANKNDTCILCRENIHVEHCFTDPVFKLDPDIFKHSIKSISNDPGFIAYYLNSIKNGIQTNEKSFIHSFVDTDGVFHYNLNNIFYIKFIHTWSEKNEIILTFFEPDHVTLFHEDITTYMLIAFRFYHLCYTIEKNIKKISISNFKYCLIETLESLKTTTQIILASVILFFLFDITQCQRASTCVDDTTYY